MGDSPDFMLGAKLLTSAAILTANGHRFAVIAVGQRCWACISIVRA